MKIYSVFNYMDNYEIDWIYDNVLEITEINFANKSHKNS